jgi:hypothetical protein
VASEFRFAKGAIDKKIYVWELELLAREIILNSGENTARKTIQKWNYFTATLNKLRELENNIYRKYGSNKNIRSEVHRIAHRQFPWQSRPNEISMTRYFKIFSYNTLEKIIQDVIGLTTKEVYLIGMALFSVYLKEFALFYPPSKIDIEGINKENLKTFLDRFSAGSRVLKNKLLSEQEMNEKFAYSYSSLRAYPIINMAYEKRDAYACPLPTLFLWRLTSGIYYDICKENGFDNAFGPSFQNYVGEVLESANIEKKINNLW